MRGGTGVTRVLRHTLDEALAAMAGGARPSPGGTDLVVAARHGKRAARARSSRSTASARSGDLGTAATASSVGRSSTHAEIECRDAFGGLDGRSRMPPRSSARPLRATSARSAAISCNSSPAMDTGAPLLVLEAPRSSCARRTARARCRCPTLDSAPARPRSLPASCSCASALPALPPARAARTCGSSTGVRWRSPSWAPRRAHAERRWRPSRPLASR